MGQIWDFWDQFSNNFDSPGKNIPTFDPTLTSPCSNLSANFCPVSIFTRQFNIFPRLSCDYCVWLTGWCEVIGYCLPAQCWSNLALFTRSAALRAPPQRIIQYFIHRHWPPLNCLAGLSNVAQTILIVTNLVLNRIDVIFFRSFSVDLFH